jgi:beta-aspartyl-dipeptidase (metallo-type)
MLTLIENGEIYTPDPGGTGSVLLCRDQILKVGHIDRSSVEALDIELEIIDASECFVLPGFIDPHEHLLGGSGEEGFSSQTPEISASEIIQAGITTVVGCLGVDTTMKTMSGLLAKCKALKEEGLSAYIWSGGYHVPPTAISSSLRNDIMFIEEVIGAGEIAISDERSTDHDPLDLARLVIDTHNGGMLSRKSGVTHFHVGTGPQGLKPLTDMLENFKVIKPQWLYPTHITRSKELMTAAIGLAKTGSYVDIDVVDEDLPKWLRFYADHGGDMEKLTISSDASKTSPCNLLEQIRQCTTRDFSLPQVIKLVTENTAQVLKLRTKGALRPGSDADVVVLDRSSLQIKDVVASGRHLLRNGRVAFKEAFLADSNRSITLEGLKI